MWSGVTYTRLDEEGLHICTDGVPQILPVDHVIVCARQELERDLYEALLAAGCKVHLIGGAQEAVEVDAKRGIEAGTLPGASL